MQIRMLGGGLTSTLSESKRKETPTRELLFLLLILACPLAMFFMMRGGHGHGGHGQGSRREGLDDERLSAEQLRQRRAELDRLIEAREEAAAGGDEAWVAGRERTSG